MALDGLNAAAAAAILNQAKVDPATKTRGVIVSAFVPGPLGLAVPVIMARNAAKRRGGGSGTGGTTDSKPAPSLVTVPDVSAGRLSAKDASARLRTFRLVAIEAQTYGDDADQSIVVGQDPQPGALVPLDSEVTVFIGAGVPPPDTEDQDLDQDLTNKMNKLAQDSTKLISDKLDAIQQTLSGGAGATGATGTTGASGATGTTGGTASRPMKPATP